jgi:hypothetical protein
MPSLFVHVDGCLHVLQRLKLFHPSHRDFHMAILGSLVPDLEWVGLVKGMHGRCMEYFAHTVKHDRKMVPMAIGMLSHELLDGVIEPEYIEKNEPAAAGILAQYGFDAKMGRWTAHSLVEQAVDSHIVERKPWLFDFLHRAKCGIPRRYLKHAARSLTRFFGGDAKLLYKAFLEYVKFDISVFRSHESMSQLWLQHVFLWGQRERIERMSKGHAIARLTAKLAIAWHYLKFRLFTKTGRMREAFAHARERFRDHHHVCRKGNRVIERALLRTLQAHALVK